MTAQARTELPYIPALDGLRGVAVLGILLFHAGELRGGWLGVDLFFVLSGFLITSLLLAEYDSNGRISLRRFWIRRARRLLPALLLFLLGVSAYAAIFAEPQALTRIRGDGLATLFYVANWNDILAHHDYWALFEAPSPLDHAWSLSIEEQFYLFWPPLALLLLLRSGGSRRVLGGVAGLLALASAAWMAWLFDERTGTTRVYFGTDTRAAATLVGAALAATLRRRLRDFPGLPAPGMDVAALAAALTLAFGWFTFDGTDPRIYRGLLFVLAILAALVIGGVVAAPAGLTSRALKLAPLRFLGQISYGVYLWHWPLFIVLSPERIGLSNLPLTGLRISVSVAVAAVSYYALEQPIRRGAIAPRRLLVMALIGSAVVAACLIGSTRGAVDAKPDMDVERIADPLPDDGPLDVLLVGDSVAAALGEPFERRAADRGLRALPLGHFGCTLLVNSWIRFPQGGTLFLDKCDEYRGKWLEAVETRKPGIVLVIEGGTGIGERKLGDDWRQPCEPEYREALDRDLVAAIGAYAVHGARTVLTTSPVPELTDVNPLYLGLRRGVTIDTLRAPMAESLECQNQVRRSVAARTGTDLIDLAAFVCPDGLCRREVDGVPLRSDGVHFEGAAADIVSDWLLDRIGELDRIRRPGE